MAVRQLHHVLTPTGEQRIHLLEHGHGQAMERDWASWWDSCGGSNTNSVLTTKKTNKQKQTTTTKLKPKNKINKIKTNKHTKKTKQMFIKGHYTSLCFEIFVFVFSW